jgi:hypothetical protein
MNKKKKKTIATAAVGGGVLLGNNTRFLKTQQFSISKPSPVSVSEIGFLTSQWVASGFPTTHQNHSLLLSLPLSNLSSHVKSSPFLLFSFGLD